MICEKNEVDLLEQALTRLIILVADKYCDSDNDIAYHFDYNNAHYDVLINKKDSEQTRNLTDKETAIYNSWLDSEAKDTGVNIMDGEQNV